MQVVVLGQPSGRKDDRSESVVRLHARDPQSPGQWLTTLGKVRTLLTAVFVVVGVALIAIGIVYFTVKAGSLPSFFPGHITGSSGHRDKHGIAAVAVGVVVIVLGFMLPSLLQRR